MRSLRRKNRQVPVSFFAFQDIITALAGSMLIIVLIIAYGKSRTANNPGKAMGSRSEYTQLQQKITLQSEELKFKQTMLQQQQNRRNSRDGEAAAQRIQKLKSSTRQLRQHRQEQQNELQSLQRRTAAQYELLKKVDPQLLKGVEELESLQQQLRSRQYMLKVINPDNKHIFLLDCARSRWSFSDINNPVRLLGKADPTPATALAELTAHLRSVPQQKARLILAVRPSAGNFAQALKEHLQTNFPELEIIYEPLIWENAGGFVL